MSVYLLPLVIVTVIGLVAGVSLTTAATVFSDNEHPLFEPMREALPGANCGVCGYVGCDDYARAVLGGEDHTKCKVGRQKTIDAIAGILAQADGRP